MPRPICLRLLRQLVRRAFSRAKTGNKIAARIYIIAITTNNSISVKALIRFDIRNSLNKSTFSMPLSPKTVTQVSNLTCNNPLIFAVCGIHPENSHAFAGKDSADARRLILNFEKYHSSAKLCPATYLQHLSTAARSGIH